MDTVKEERSENIKDEQMNTTKQEQLGETKQEPMDTNAEEPENTTKEEPMNVIEDSVVEVKTESVEVKPESTDTPETQNVEEMDTGGGNNNVETKHEAIEVDGEVEIPKDGHDVEVKVEVETKTESNENVSQKKVVKPVRIAQGNLKNLQAYSLLTKKCDVDLIDVSKAITEHTYYPKVTKPYAKLDSLLERRIKLEDIEKRQRDSILQQLQWKLKLEAAKEEEKEQSSSPEKSIISLPRPVVSETADSVKQKPVKHACYSPLCQVEDGIGGLCYSVSCRFESEQEEEDEELDVDDAGEVQMEVDDDEKAETDHGKKENAADKSGTEDEEVDILGDKDEDDKSNKTAAENLNTNNANSMNDRSTSNVPKVVHVPLNKGDTAKSQGGPAKAGASSPKGKTMISIPGNLAQLIAQKTGQNLTYSQAQAFIRQALEKMSVEDIKSKIPKKRTTKDKVQLLKITKGGIKKKTQKKSSLPVTQKFITPSGFKSLFVLEKWEAKKLSRKAGKIEVHSFKYDCKMNNVNWPYPCPRPLFKTAFRYRLQTIKSLAAAALQLRVFWTCIRWDDMATKPPAGGTNTISTETEITTTELLKRRDIGPHGLRSEFLVRKIIVPLGVPEQPKGNICFSLFSKITLVNCGNNASQCLIVYITECISVLHEVQLTRT